jgi:hypothetical protein
MRNVLEDGISDNHALNTALQQHMADALPQLQVDWCRRQGPDCLRAVVHDIRRAGQQAIEYLRKDVMKQSLKHLAKPKGRGWEKLTGIVRCALVFAVMFMCMWQGMHQTDTRINSMMLRFAYAMRIWEGALQCCCCGLR